MARSKTRPLRLIPMASLLVFGLVAGYGLASWGSSRLPSGILSDPDSGLQQPLLARQPGPAFSLADADQPLDLSYLQQFCPDQPDLAAPGLCALEAEQAEALSQQITPEAAACWQQIYDYAFGPLANQAYLGGDPPPPASGEEADDPSTEEIDCHQGAITVLVNPSFASQVEADNNDAARFQDILFIIAAIIEYEAYRTQVPTNWSQLDGMVNFSYYDPANVNLPGTWDTYPATAGAIPSLSASPGSDDQIAVDPETNQLPLPTSGRWGDADQVGDPQLLLIFHKAACTSGGTSPVELSGLRRYAVVYKPSAEEGFACHAF